MAAPGAPDQDRQRIDRWLWCARFFKTRSLAAKFVAGGKVRVNGTRVTKAAHTLKVGDVLTFPLGPGVRVVEVLGFVARRGSATVAATLYDDRSPPLPPKPDRPFSTANPAPTSSPDRRARARLRQMKSQG